MKRFITLSVIMVICISGCQNVFLKLVGAKYALFIRNDTEKPVSAYGTYTQKDTSLPFSKPLGERITPSSILVGLESSSPYLPILSESHDWLKSLSDKDTVRVYVFDYEQFESAEWETMRDSYSVLVRYDFTAKDLTELGFRISYPPSEKMKSIKMWPPYEEVIKNAEQ